MCVLLKEEDEIVHESPCLMFLGEEEKRNNNAFGHYYW